MRATYSPEDNKLRIYPTERLDEATYTRVKDAGYKWAPKQELFVAPMWTPGRAELAIELCGFIGDEDTTLVERATEKAERLEDLSERRADEAERTYAAVSNSDLVVGNHSRAKAEKEAKKLEQKMKRADSLWDEADYWKDRAKGAIRTAKYKERPDVRHRRIKGIEADKRKNEKGTAEAYKFLKYWEKPDLNFALAKQVANYDHTSQCFKLADFPRDPPASQYEGTMSLWSALDGGVINEKQAAEIAIRVHHRNIARAQKWHDHYENRLAYERAMLDEQGGVISDKYDIKVGGKVLVSGAWLVVLRVNKSLGAVSSLTTQAPAGHRCKNLKINIEEVQGYEEPTEEVAAAAKAATKQHPICNFPGEGFHEMTKAEWDKQYSKIIRKVEATDEHGPYRRRVFFTNHYKTLQVFITDAKVVMPPAPTAEAGPTLPEPDYMDRRPRVEHEAPDTRREELKQAIKAGVQVVSANQLFPTPKDLAERMADILCVKPGHRVLEPSAGTGRLLGALGCRMFGTGLAEEDRVVAVEINPTLADRLEVEFPLTTVHRKDFLECNGDLGKFDRIIMNPPFEKGSDIKHIKHALTFLKPGGKLVAICANGARQNDQLKPLADEWEDLPPNTFAEAGTGVNTALLTFYA